MLWINEKESGDWYWEWEGKSEQFCAVQSRNWFPERINWKFRGLSDCVWKTTLYVETWRYDKGQVLSAQAKICTWKGQFSAVSCKNILTRVLKVFSNKSICPRSLWSSWRMAIFKQSIFQLRNKILTSFVWNQLRSETTIWNPVVKYWIYSVISNVLEFVQIQCICYSDQQLHKCNDSPHKQSIVDI